jgi:single-stranded-DNA-specific exonuclease
VRRGITDVAEAQAFLDPAAYTPTLPDALPDLPEAADRLLAAIRGGEHILVWGDFDVDGQTSTALLVDALKDLGAEPIYHVPHRMKHGHGVQVDVLKDYLARIDLVLTCDTGVAAHEAAQAAAAAGVTMLITDHHALPPTLPHALAVVNPQRLPPDHALRDLPGVGVAFKLAQQLYTLAGRAGDEARLLDLVALGIVADVATQRHDTRYLLQLGIDRLRFPERVGLKALIASAGIDPANLTADMIGFQIGPRLNALGRLDNARLAVHLLTTNEELLARQVAAQLEVLNERRKQIQDQITAAALEQIEADRSLLDDYKALVLSSEHWHPGVIGIVASRLVEMYERPVLLFAAPPGGIARGSARSVPGVDIGAAIAANADMLISHGGHPGAAGCALQTDLLPQFRRRLSNTVRETWDHTQEAVHRVDAVMPLEEVDMPLAEDLGRLAPFGAGNPPIHLLSPRLRVADTRPFGMSGRHRRVLMEDSDGVRHVLLWWRGSEEDPPRGLHDVVYIPRINDYKGKRSLQLEWVDSRPTPGVPLEVSGARHTVVDLRREADPLAALPPDGLAIWAEGVDSDDLPFERLAITTRYDVRPAPMLAIWTTPPGRSELAEMIAATGAREFYVVTQHTANVTPEGFLRRLGGLVKYALSHYRGDVSVLRLAAATAQRQAAVRYGLEWMAAQGQLTLTWRDADVAQLSDGGEARPADVEPLQDALRRVLAETRAFHDYFHTAALDSFFDV